ncbi:MAG: peptidoglycan bridge formation glycyltransferase FemA/FemB family protein [Chloroflexota bacterium]|nr:peptidoglycan bridge formation glycyltransferase FemA/FemB family protein [Chloroflexota bacterium]
MVMRLVPIEDRREWNQVLAQFPQGHLLQSYEWGEVKGRWGWQPLRFLLREGGERLAVASVLRRPVPHTPFCLLYVPKGPAFDYEDLSLWPKVLGTLEELSRRQKAIWLKIDPDLRRNVGVENSELEPVAEAVIELLEERGWRFSPEQIQFRNTMLMDLRPSEEDILMDMHSKTRYNIRLSGRKGVRVEEVGEDGLPQFYDLYAETSARNDFLIRPFAYYRDVWQTFLREGLAELFLAYYEGLCLAGLILLRWEERAWYMYGASSNEERQRMPNYALQWAAIRWAKAQGCATYDLWGAPDVFDESDPLWGVYRFKRGFGGQVVRHLGAYDFPVYPLLYRLFNLLLPRYRALLRWRGASRG